MNLVGAANSAKSSSNLIDIGFPSDCSSSDESSTEAQVSLCKAATSSSSTSPSTESSSGPAMITTESDVCDIDELKKQLTSSSVKPTTAGATAKTTFVAIALHS